jgi:glycosyltransferase involved in cell wall biosynthesis
MPSLTDTLGQSVMEALASGLPAIVSDQGGPCTLVRDGETGVIVRSIPNEPHARAWVEAIVSLVRDHTMRARLSRSAAEHSNNWSFECSFQDFWQMHADRVTRRST